MNLKVSHHISQCSKHVHNHDKFQIIPIYKIKKDDKNLRKEKETHLINLLKPDLNQSTSLANIKVADAGREGHYMIIISTVLLSFIENANVYLL